MDFVIDTEGCAAHLSDDENGATEDKMISKLLEEYRASLPVDYTFKSSKREKTSPVSKLFEEIGWSEEKCSKKENILEELEKSKIDLKEIMKKSVITPEFERQHTLPPVHLPEKILKKQHQKEADKTKGKKWFGMRAGEITEEVKQSLEILQMRSILDRKRFYKKNEFKVGVLPKHFKIGRLVDSPLDYYNNRLTKKERKKTLVDELLADAEFNKYNKRKFKEIIQEKEKTHYKAWREAKKLKKKK